MQNSRAGRFVPVQIEIAKDKCKDSDKDKGKYNDKNKGKDNDKNKGKDNDKDKGKDNAMMSAKWGIVARAGSFG